VRRMFTVLAVVLLGVAIAPTPAHAADTVWKVINDRSDRCLDQDYSGGTPHATIQAWLCLNPGDNQRWILHPLGGSRYTLKNVRSGQCLDQDWSGGVVHYNITAHACNGQINQQLDIQWFASQPSHAYMYAPLSDNAQQHCLDQSWSGGVQHPTVSFYTCLNQTNQVWVFVSAE
jgi:hypothetical protein